MFYYQTVYDPRVQALTSLEEIPEDLAGTIEQEFLGDRTVIEKEEGLIIAYA